MSLSSMLRSSLPSTSKSANSPRVSSPLATHSSSAASSEGDESESGSDSDSQDSDSIDDDDSDDDEVELGVFLARAKEAARTRALAATADSALPTAGTSTQFEDMDLAELKGDEEPEPLPAVYTRHADPALVFQAAASDVKGKRRAVLSPTGEFKDDEDTDDILPGVKSKWGTLPQARKSKKERKKAKAVSAGKDWFDLPRRPASSLSNEEKRELQALRLTNVMDPKRFMKGETKRNDKKLPEFFQTGYIIESGQGPRAGAAAPSEKIKKQSFLGNVLADSKGTEWSKRKYLQLQEKAQSGGKGFYKKRMHDRKSVDGGKRKGKGGAGKRR